MRYAVEGYSTSGIAHQCIKQASGALFRTPLMRMSSSGSMSTRSPTLHSSDPSGVAALYAYLLIDLFNDSPALQPHSLLLTITRASRRSILSPPPSLVPPPHSNYIPSRVDFGTGVRRATSTSSDYQPLN
ncbi:hypothetical protein CCMSSC00406_0007695 [Pleurotus cornucopiae]|uniref:Uncharacterized protein n=1 Tax=Pleurotus cornucopiae TaxID=5321 RepID=A0ACB7J1T8_PLECO|nr:hypothetical protein CCMSSC00406_0007695 [Pleurotus cornucopiae]